MNLLNIISSILTTFTQTGVWVLGFFFLLNRLFDSERSERICKYSAIAVLAYILIETLTRYAL